MHFDELKKRLDAYDLIYQTENITHACAILQGLRKLPKMWAAYDIASDDKDFYVYVWFSFLRGDVPDPGPKEVLENEIRKAKAFAEGMDYAWKGMLS